MRTTYLFTLFVALLFISCGTKSKDDTKVKDSAEYKATGRPAQALKYKEVVSMLRYYDSVKRDILRKTTLKGGNDTRENFYPLKDLKAYIAYVEKLAEDKNISITGINIISAAYPQDKKYGLKQGYQTLIFMPATTINGKKNVSFDPLYSGKESPKLFAEILYSDYNYSFRGYQPNKTKKKMRSATFLQITDPDMDSSAANRTHISPPY